MNTFNRQQLEIGSKGKLAIDTIIKRRYAGSGASFIGQINIVDAKTYVDRFNTKQSKSYDDVIELKGDYNNDNFGQSYKVVSIKKDKITIELETIIGGNEIYRSHESSSKNGFKYAEASIGKKKVVILKSLNETLFS